MNKCLIDMELISIEVEKNNNKYCANSEVIWQEAQIICRKINDFIV